MKLHLTIDSTPKNGKRESGALCDTSWNIRAELVTKRLELQKILEGKDLGVRWDQNTDIYLSETYVPTLAIPTDNLNGPDAAEKIRDALFLLYQKCGIFHELEEGPDPSKERRFVLDLSSIDAFNQSIQNPKEAG